MSQERIEAAANALSEISGMRFDGFWSRLDELESEDREYAIAEARFALERSDPFLFSDEAIERAAQAMFALKTFNDWDSLPEQIKRIWRDHTRAVVAALKGDA